MTRHCSTSCLNLACRDPTSTRRLESVLTKTDLTAPLCKTAITAFLHFAELRSLGLQHTSVLAQLTGGCATWRFLAAIGIADDLALKNPNLNANHTVSGVGLIGRVVNVGTEGMQRHSALAVPL